jgi:hypothetical protein
MFRVDDRNCQVPSRIVLGRRKSGLGKDGLLKKLERITLDVAIHATSIATDLRVTL